MREIVFDTETTGLDPATDRLVEIGCVELVNHFPTGRTFQAYVNPERPVPAEAARVHGLKDDFLADKPVFAMVADELLAFIAEDRLIAHNASFDISFLNAEFGRAGRPSVPDDRVVDTLMIARRRHPAGPNSLDALCNRYAIDLGRRSLHGALLDAELLSEVYIELIGGRQAALGLGEVDRVPTIAAAHSATPVGARPVPRPFNVNAAELAAHQAGVAMLGAGAIWLRYLGSGEAAASA
jgi:DNA polymerase III subunit epsilon